MSNQVTRKKEHNILVVVTDGRQRWKLCRVRRRPRDLYVSASTRSFGYHVSYHNSGKIHIKKEEPPPAEERPALILVGSAECPAPPLHDLGRRVDVCNFIFSVDSSSLGQFQPFNDNVAESIVYIDKRRYPSEALIVKVAAVGRRNPNINEFVSQLVSADMRMVHLDTATDPWILVGDRFNFRLLYRE